VGSPFIPVLEQNLLLGRFGLCGVALRGVTLGVFAAEALDPPRGVQQFLLAGEERMARRADFYVDVAVMGRAGDKAVAAGAVYAHFAVLGKDCCLHVSFGHLSNL